MAQYLANITGKFAKGDERGRDEGEYLKLTDLLVNLPILEAEMRYNRKNRRVELVMVYEADSHGEAWTTVTKMEMEIEERVEIELVCEQVTRVVKGFVNGQS